MYRDEEHTERFKELQYGGMLALVSFVVVVVLLGIFVYTVFF